MKKIIYNLKLKTQLVLISLSTIIIASIFIIVILPSALTPFYENNIYEMLKQPLPFIGEKSHERQNKHIAYIVWDQENYMVSRNFLIITKNNDVKTIIKLANSIQGKIILKGESYYYQRTNFDNKELLTITDSSYIEMQQASLNRVIYPIMIITLIITMSILVAYANYMVKKISKVKQKIDNFNNDDYNHKHTFLVNDELKSLLVAAENSRMELINREIYKNEMFQNISHELKTPIMIISSHVEAALDKTISNKKALLTINEEIKNLNKQVATILQLNKINFMENNKPNFKKKIDILPTINETIERLSIIKPNVKWVVNNDYKYYGSYELWEIIIINLLNNAIKYTNNKIVITLKQDQIIIFNDGNHIDNKLLKQIFEPYRKGQNGHHGLGLTIVEKSLNVCGYKINVHNVEGGVEFNIYR